MRRHSLTIVVVLASIFACGLANAQEMIPLQPPGERDFIVDNGELIRPEDEAKIKEIANKLLTDKATPIIVVTISAIENYAPALMRIETFATLLFDQWQIGHAKLHGQNWNTGILLLISVGDRKARIELGAGWGRESDAKALEIMESIIIPQFKAGNFSGGIVAGVEALDKMARGLEMPKPPPKPVEAKHILIGLGLIGLLIFTIVSLIRSGMSGWAWIFWGALFAILGMLLYNMARNAGRGGGGFSGGSFGGGFSGGGGATGSW